MSSEPRRSNAEVLDVLYAVALGEGFISAMYEIKDELVSAEVFTLGLPGQTFYRVLLGFLIIIASWLHYRREMFQRGTYPASEFAVDIIVILLYMALFLFIDAPAAYHSIVAGIWILYTVARVDPCMNSIRYSVFCLSFSLVFVLIAIWSAAATSAAAEWARLLASTGLVVAFRIFDRRLRPVI